MSENASLALRFSRFFIRHRLAHLIVIGALTVFFAYHALQLQVFSQFIDLLPRQHPFIQVYEKYNRQFGSANLVVAALVSPTGSIYNEEMLEALYSFTDRIDMVEGVDHLQVTSITSTSVREQEIDASGVLRSAQILGDQTLALLEAQFLTRRVIQRAVARGEPAPADLAALAKLVATRRQALADQVASTRSVRIEQLRDRSRADAIRALRRESAELDLLRLRLRDLPPEYRLAGEDLKGPWGSLLPPELLRTIPDRIRANKLAYGRLVSLDESSALVMAGFLEGRLDYEAIFNEVYGIKTELERRGGVEIHLTGLPILTGWCFHYATQILLILLVSFGVIMALLGLYFRRWYGVVLPFSGAAVSAVWGLGFISLMGYQLDPLVLVIPMLITSRAISHSVQFVERFYEEYQRLHDKEQAVVSSMAELLRPGTLAIVTDSFGILVIGVSSIPLMHKVAVFGAFWAISIVVTEMLLNRLLIMYFPAPRRFEHRVPRSIRAILEVLARVASDRRKAAVVVAVWLVIAVTCFVMAGRVQVGDSRPGTPILWPDSEYNRSAALISSKFYGADELMVIVQTPEPFGIHHPDAMHQIETFQRYVEQDPKVGGSISIVDYLKAITRTFHYQDPRWLTIPYTGQQVGGLLYLYEAGSPDPRVLSPYRDDQAQVAAVHVYYADHLGSTIDRAIARVERYVREHPTGTVSIRLAPPARDPLRWLRPWLGPLLPPPDPALEVLLREGSEYALQAVQHPDRREAPPPDSEDRILTLPSMTQELRDALVEAGYDDVAKIARADPVDLAQVPGYDLVTAQRLRSAARLDRRAYTVVSEWRDEGRGIRAEVRRRSLYEDPGLWIRYKDQDWAQRETRVWSDGASFGLASGLIGVLAASNDEVGLSNRTTFIACFATTFLVVLLSYRSFAIGLLMLTSLGTASLVSLAYMWLAHIGFDVNTLPVQALGVGLGVDYALYVMDRIVNERRRGHALEEAVSLAIRTTGMAVFFTGTTIIAGIIFWYFLSSLRFAGDMSLLLSILFAANLLGAVLLIPSMTTLFRPGFASGVEASGG